MKMNRTKSALIVCGVLLMAASAAIAGKIEREYMKEVVKPAIAKAKKTYKSSCGCALTVVADPSMKTKDDLNLIRSTVNSVEREVGKYCSDKESKAAVCKMKTLKIVKADDTGFSFSGSTGTAKSDGQSYVSFDMMTDVIDQ